MLDAFGQFYILFVYMWCPDSFRIMKNTTSGVILHDITQKSQIRVIPKFSRDRHVRITPENQWVNQESRQEKTATWTVSSILDDGWWWWVNQSLNQQQQQGCHTHTSGKGGCAIYNHRHHRPTVLTYCSSPSSTRLRTIALSSPIQPRI